MYNPKHFEEPRLDVMRALIQARPLATLVTLSPAGLSANHIPLHLRDDGSQYGVLVGHVARANPIWKDHRMDVDALAIFQGPDAYITPSDYATKRETGKVVPTWNYAVVHASGPLRVIDEPDWVRAQLEALTEQNEAQFAEPWQVGDAPRDYTDKLVGAIVGIEIPIALLAGKWKVSQNQPEANRAGVIAGLTGRGDAEAAAMAALVHEGSKSERA